MNQIAKAPENQIATESTAVLSMIERVALNPDVDISKLEKMLDMQERILDRNAKQEFAASLANLQADLPEVEKVAHGHNIKYAKFEHILAAIKPHLIAHGFAITHRCNNADGSVIVTAVLSHRGGHSEETSITLPADTTGNKNAVQAIGSSMEYGRRYTMNSLLGIATKAADDDGNSALMVKLPDHIKPYAEKMKLSESMDELRAVWKDAAKKLKTTEANMLTATLEEARRRLA